MPKAFTACVQKGGRVRTISIGKNKYMPVCFLGGKSFQGHIHTKKTDTKEKK